MISERPTILEHAATLADPTRSRILLATEETELTVSELCSVLQLPQSTVSRHLKQLRDQGWLLSRAEGARRFYASRVERLDPASRKLWRLVREGVAASPGARSDLERLREVLRQRRARSEEFFAASAGEWDGLRDELFGRWWELQALAAFLDRRLVIGDLGCGTGRLVQHLAPFVDRVIGIDSSPSMLAAARQRLAGQANVELRQGRLEALPLETGALDVASIFLTLHHVADPRGVVREAARVLRPGGRLSIVDMQPHEREEYQQEMGHVWLGFSPEALSSLCADADLVDFEHVPLAVDLEARGPSLFLARARRRQEPSAVTADFSARSNRRPADRPDHLQGGFEA